MPKDYCVCLGLEWPLLRCLEVFEVCCCQHLVTIHDGIGVVWMQKSQTWHKYAACLDRHWNIFSCFWSAKYYTYMAVLHFMAMWCLSVRFSSRHTPRYLKQALCCTVVSFTMSFLLTYFWIRFLDPRRMNSVLLVFIINRFSSILCCIASIHSVSWCIAIFSWGTVFAWKLVSRIWSSVYP